MKTQIFTAREMDQNNYLCWCQRTGEAVVIDCGAISSGLEAFLRENQIKLKKILLTHGHYDHTMGAEAVKAAANASLCAHSTEKALLADPLLNVSVLFGAFTSFELDESFEDGDEIGFGHEKLTVIHTPGHTAGSVCFYHAAGILFSGDTLFRASVGRSDLPTADGQVLGKSIRGRLCTLPGETHVLPGHGPRTTIAYEIAHNPYIK